MSITSGKLSSAGKQDGSQKKVSRKEPSPSVTFTGSFKRLPPMRLVQHHPSHPSLMSPSVSSGLISSSVPSTSAVSSSSSSCTDSTLVPAAESDCTMTITTLFTGSWKATSYSASSAATFHYECDNDDEVEEGNDCDSKSGSNSLSDGNTYGHDNKSDVDEEGNCLLYTSPSPRD